MSDKRGPRSDPEIGRKDEFLPPGQNIENDHFNRHYNKELRVSKDEIPIVLAELNESSVAFIKKEQFERALNLLQKAYGIMDAIDFSGCRRDHYHLFVMFHNMALCYQKMQHLEECAQCIEHALEHMPLALINLEEKSISYRMRKLFMIGKLKLQYCAILSQIHRHKDALDQAREGVKVCHQMVTDMHQLALFYCKREKVNKAYKENEPQAQERTFDEYASRFEKQRNQSNNSRNRSFSSYLSQQEAYTGFESLTLGNVKNNSFQGKAFSGRQASVGGPNAAQSMKSGGMISSHSLSSFCTVNELEKSMSIVERTAKKLLPILAEVKRRMIPDKRRPDQPMKQLGSEDSDDDVLVDLSKLQGKGPKSKVNFDMKNILGYLNQGENLQSLSIGNIMQLQSVRLKDLIEEGKNELELTRESFILKISHLAVSYFCYSTEIRFILQMKEDLSYDVSQKQKESEFWHAKSLELACSFLPGECPLLNHINMSFQKHFAPIKQVIKEDEEEDEALTVVKPLTGIENQKFAPIIKKMDDIDVAITPYQMTPLAAVTRPFISQLKSFNEYTEGNQSVQMQQPSQSSMRGRNKRVNTSHGAGKKDSMRTNPMLDDANPEMLAALDDMEKSTEDGDLALLEMLFRKVQSNHGIDKSSLLRRLASQQQTNGPILNSGKSKGFDKSTTSHNASSAVQDISHQEMPSAATGNDFLMDENILTNESGQHDDDDDHSSSLIMQTPSGKQKVINHMTGIVKGNHSISANLKSSIGSAQQAAIKRPKAAKAGSVSTAKMMTGQPTASRNHHPSSQTVFQNMSSASLQQRPKTQMQAQRNSNRDAKGQSIQSASDLIPSGKGKPTSAIQKYIMTENKFTHNMIESKTKRALQRPFSGGIQKMIKTESGKGGRPQNYSQKTFAMYDQQRQAKMQLSKDPIQTAQKYQQPHGDSPGKPVRNFAGIAPMHQPPSQEPPVPGSYVQKLSNSSRPIVASKGLSILTKAPQQMNNKEAQYEDLKKKLLTEYKKIKKTAGGKGSLTQVQKNQIEQTLQNSAKAMQSTDGNSQSGSNLNNSTASAHLNVYKPTFIINNSYQPNEGETGNGQGKNVNDPHSMQVSAGPSRDKKDMSHPADSAKGKPKVRGSSNGAGMPAKSKTIATNHQQMLLMNVLMSQGMDRASAQAQVQAQMNAHAKDKTVTIQPTSKKNVGTRYGQRAVAPGGSAFDKQIDMRAPHYVREEAKSSTDIRFKTDLPHSRQQANIAGSFSMANLPQTSNIVTGGKMMHADPKRQQSHGMLRKK